MIFYLGIREYLGSLRRSKWVTHCAYLRGDMKIAVVSLLSGLVVGMVSFAVETFFPKYVWMDNFVAGVVVTVLCIHVLAVRSSRERDRAFVNHYLRNTMQSIVLLSHGGNGDKQIVEEIRLLTDRLDSIVPSPNLNPEIKVKVKSAVE